MDRENIEKEWKQIFGDTYDLALRVMTPEQIVQRICDLEQQVYEFKIKSIALKAALYQKTK